jgi:hypothetical protein
MGVLFHTMAFQQMHVSHMRRCPQDVQEKAVYIYIGNGVALAIVRVKKLTMTYTSDIGREKENEYVISQA